MPASAVLVAVCNQQFVFGIGARAGNEVWTATLHVRGVPDELYEQVRILAQLRKRSLSAEIIQLLEQALTDEALRQEQTALLNAIWHDRYTCFADLTRPALVQ